MCAIYGIAKKQNAQTKSQMKKIDKVLTNLTRESEIRGEHSTGLAFFKEDSNPIVFKSLKKSSNLVKSKDWNTIREQLKQAIEARRIHTELKGCVSNP